MPKGFFPQQDTGRLVGGIRGRPEHLVPGDAASKLDSFIEIVRADPAVETVVGFTGGGAAQHAASMFVTLKPLAERELSRRPGRSRGCAGSSRSEPGASLFLQPVQDVRIGGRQGSAQYQYTLQADDLEELRAWEPRDPRAR